MSNKQQHIAIPLEQFFIRLENAGFEMNTARKLRLLTALEQKGASYIGDFEKLKYFLAPLIARNDREQAQFYQLFDTFWEECQQQSKAVPKKEDSPGVDNRHHFWWLLLLPLLAFLTWFFWPPPTLQEVRLQKKETARAGEILSIENLSPIADTLGFFWEIQQLADNKTIHHSSQFNLSWLISKELDGTDLRIILKREDLGENWSKIADTTMVHITCANPPVADTILWPTGNLIKNKTYTFDFKSEKPVTAEWHFNGKDTLVGQQVTYLFATEGEAQVTLFLYRDNRKTDCYTTYQKQLIIGSDRPYLSLSPLQADQPRRILKIQYWLWALIGIPFLFALWNGYRWWMDRKGRQAEQSQEKTIAELEEDHPISENAPYFIPYLSPEDAISVPPDFFRIADVLRRRELGQRQQFDATASVKATIDAGTFPTWRSRANSRPVDYLVFCHFSDERQQQDQLFRRLTNFLLQQESPLTVFYYDNDFEHFWNDQNQNGISLELIYRSYPYHRLIILGNAHALINPYSSLKASLLKKPMDIIERWPRRLILTDEFPKDWSFQEILLYRSFLIYPADTQGIRAGVEKLDQIEEYQSGSFEYWRSEQSQHRTHLSARRRDWLDITDLKDYLKQDVDAFRWLCALAVAPSPDWTLTIKIARALDIEVTHDRLLLLTRIPWLADNEAPFDLRLELLRLLDKAEELLARQAVAEELLKVEDKVQNSFAAIDWKNNLAVQKFAIDPFDKQHKKLVKDLIQLGFLSQEQLLELDFIVQERIETTGLPTPATKGINEWLDQPEEIPIWNRTFVTTLLFFALTCLGLWQAWQFNSHNQELKKGDVPAFWQQLRLVDDEALRLHNQAIVIGQDILAKKELNEWNQAADSLVLTFDLLKRAINFRQPNAYLLADSNQLALQYDQAAKDFNFFLSDSSGVAKLLEIKQSFVQVLEQLPEKGEIRRLNSLHAFGLSYYYLWEANKQDRTKRDSAQLMYQQILDESQQGFFERIANDMPINLQSLLASSTTILVIHSLDVTARTDGGLQVKITYTIPASWTKLTTGQLTILDDKGIVPPGFKQLSKRATISQKTLRFDINYLPATELKTDTIRFWLEADNSQLVSKTIAYSYTWKAKQAQDIPVPNNKLIVAGQVLNQKEQPVANANIRIEEKGQGTTTSPVISTTDSNGRFRMEITSDASEYLLRIKSDNCESSLLTKTKTALEQNQIIHLTCQVLAADSDQDGIEDVIAPSNDMAKIIAQINKNMVKVEGGTFTMGCTDEQGADCYDDEKPKHQVELSAYYMSKYEVTNEAYTSFLNNNGQGNQEEGGVEWINLAGASSGEKCRIQKNKGIFEVEKGYKKHAVIYVSWYGARAFTKWMSKETGKKYRLATEAEWEYAARGGQQGIKKANKYAGTNNLKSVAWYDENSYDKGESNSDYGVHAVGEKLSNELGLYDMSGNVWEWCNDWYDNNYYELLDKQSVAKNPKGADNGSSRVYRGGSWYDNARRCRVSFRYRYTPDDRNDSLGFRLVHSSR